MSALSDRIMQIYEVLLKYFGPRGWWPGESQLEIVIGAILTQAVAWKNVEKAIKNLKEAGLMDLEALRSADEALLAELIKPALYNRQKAKKIKVFIAYLFEFYNGDLNALLDEPLEPLREKLLSLWGIGPETADSILLYAASKEKFVVDAYTRRIFFRLGMVPEDVNYNQMQDLLEKNVINDIQIYNEYHALLVALGNNFCKKNVPQCKACPLNNHNHCNFLHVLQEKY
ncbi:endonuclease III domain-containing protein [Syntrophomonas palmitatica]|uniref:endonuclease III domain-containing protein n=1 Tax=Syntrophomonas palmitatica TaxID=402877 RepID=UPI000B192CAC|nr:endonuclease III domain-containing protein [Syntrophomonas palmitatica]